MTLQEKAQRVATLNIRIADAEKDLVALSRSWAAPQIGDYNLRVSIPPRLVQSIKNLVRMDLQETILRSQDELNNLLT